MKNIYLLSVLLLLIVVSCEDVEVAYPGNNQTTTAVSPNGTAEWLINFNDGIGELPENSAAGLDIATLNAEDGNPDDEFSYTIASQKIDETVSNYFSIETEEGGASKLVLSNGSINYESLSGSKKVDLVIKVEDDSVLGASSYLDKNLPKNIVAYGIPAIKIRGRTKEEPYL